MFKLNNSIKYVTILFLFVVITTGACSRQNTNTQKPNILFIMSDDHTSQACGIYGGVLVDFVHTPNISRLAEEGCVLENCLVSNSICSPSRATIMSGQYSHHSGVRTLQDGLDPAKNNIAKIMQNVFYVLFIIPPKTFIYLF